MARIFVAEYHGAATAIGTALDAGDRARAANLLHRLRGAAGAVGAKELTEAAGRLESALADKGPIDADLRLRFFASAEAALAVLRGLEIPAAEDASAEGSGPGCEEPSRHLRELEMLLEAGNTRAMDHLPWLERWVETEAPGAGEELLRQIEALDFPAALEILRGFREGGVANHH
jgi:two-component system sensor histidine kinase/response regulator